MIAAALLLVVLQQGAPTPARVQMGIVVRPETVTVGDPFRVSVRVRAPAGATIEFPAAPDSAADVEALDTRRVAPAAPGAAVEQTADYRLVAWNVGRVPLELPDVVVRLAGGGVQRVSLADAAVEVRSVLPADTALRVPKPPRPPLVAPTPWWVWALLAAAVAALLWILYRLWRRRRGRGAPALVVDPYDAAQREFARVEALGLVDAGERGRYAALMVDGVRDYLAARFGAAPLSLTSRELLAALRDVRSVPAARLAPLLEEVDQVKFARRAVSVERARDVGREARAIVADTERAEQARLESERVARADAAARAASPRGRAA